MSIYRRGADFERFLVTEFWGRGWAAVRAAGSGTRAEPVPDVLAAKNGKIIIVECKTTKKDRLSLSTAIKQLAEFQKTSGGKAYIAVRFFRQRPRFYPLEELLKKKNRTIHDTDSYQSIDTILGEQNTL
ncbi:MAG: hypothetical protein KKD39_01550 [Candidatus Altiarchaeota archaeon]|nr:hypothetical protein [Candidatus Altiarchaeota archaeon]